jgi:hypothetical protein
MRNILKLISLSTLKQGLFFGLWGAIGGSLASLLTELIFQKNTYSTFILSILEVGLWFGLISSSISASLLMGQSQHLKGYPQIKLSLMQGLVPGFIAGLIAGMVAQGIFSIHQTEFIRVICWGIAGGLLGFGLSYRIPNLGRWRGLTGGGFGGIAGGGLFILFSVLFGDLLGRFFGIAAIGFFIGLVIVLVEAIFRDAWLVVHWNASEKKSISLGAEPILLGSSKEAHIYLRKDKGFPPITAKIYIENKDIILDFDQAMQQMKGLKVLRHRLRNGERRKIGDVLLEIKTSERNSPS